MIHKVYFISDVHLGLQSKDKENKKEEKLVSLLNYISQNADKLIFLGDLFDYWFEYRRVYQKGFFKTLTALKNAVDKGVETHYIIGNHDFMHRNFFEEEIGVILHQDPFEMTVNGKKFFLGHGDGLVSNDTGYKILKKILRNKFSQWMYSLIHPDFGIWLASNSSKKSRNYTKVKDYGEKDGLLEAAKKKIDSGFDYVLFGHTHKRQFEKYKNGFYINLGTWLERPCYGSFDGNSFEIKDWL